VKIKINRIVILISVLMIFIACRKSPTEPPIELNPLLTEEMVQNVNLLPGISAGNFNMLGGVDWSYSISAPEISDNEKVPLIIGLHWYRGESEQYLRCLADPGFKKLNAIIFAPDAGEFSFWEEANYSLILTLIEYAKKYWPIDESKIIISGYSDGGIASWYYGVYYPQIFSAAIPMASRNNYNKKPKIPFYVIHGENDEIFPLSETQSSVDYYKNEGADIQLVVIEGLSHYIPCSYDNALRNASDWLLNDVWE